MTLGEMKKNVFKLIEEIDELEPNYTSDPDLSKKINVVINQIQYELARFKKIPKYIEVEVDKSVKSLYEFKDIAEDIYQLDKVRGIETELKANGTVIKCLESGTMEVEYYKYPKMITEETTDDYKFELSLDALEIMPYGVASDLLASSVADGYGNIYRNIYETKLQRLDSRYAQPTIDVVVSEVI